MILVTRPDGSTRLLDEASAARLVEAGKAEYTKGRAKAKPRKVPEPDAPEAGQFVVRQDENS